MSEPVGEACMLQQAPPTGQEEDYSHCEWGNLLYI